MRTYELLELRKNPHKNPKISVNKHLIDILDHTTDEIVPNVKNNFTSFTSIDKLGINPKSRYNTPLGIYAYPTEYVVKKTGEHESLSNMEFAGDNPFVNTFKVQGNILDISNMTKNEATQYYKKISEILHNLTKKDMKECIQDVKNIINKSNSEAEVKNKVGGRFWYVTWYLVNNNLKHLTQKEPPFIWNWLFRKLGIDGVISQGDGIIHQNEKTQAVFFSKTSIYDVKRFNNTTYSRRNIPQDKKKLSDLAKSQIEYLNNHPTPEKIIQDINKGYQDNMFMALRKILLPAIHKNHELFFQIRPVYMNDTIIQMGYDGSIPKNKIEMHLEYLDKEKVIDKINYLHSSIEELKDDIQNYHEVLNLMQNKKEFFNHIKSNDDNEIKQYKTYYNIIQSYRYFAYSDQIKHYEEDKKYYTDQIKKGHQHINKYKKQIKKLEAYLK